MKFEYPYEVSRDDARVRLEALGEYLYNRHGIKVTWSDGDKARFSGKYLLVTIDGELTIEDGKVHFSGKDPGMLLRKRAVNYLKDKLATYLNPATAPEDLPRNG